jgi:hypothetical protein
LAETKKMEEYGFKMSSFEENSRKNIYTVSHRCPDCIFTPAMRLEGLPKGAYNIRKNGKLEGREVSANINIETNEKGNGIIIDIKPGTKNESVHIPVILSQAGLHDVVYNTFIIGEGSDVTIVAGCGIHCGGHESEGHSGIHEFHIKAGAKVRYVEKHIAIGEGSGKRILNPTTKVFMEENAQAQMELTQMGGVDEAKRVNEATVGAGSVLLITERVMTEKQQSAESRNEITLAGTDNYNPAKRQEHFQPEQQQHNQCDCRNHNNPVVDLEELRKGELTEIPFGQYTGFKLRVKRRKQATTDNNTHQATDNSIQITIADCARDGAGTIAQHSKSHSENQTTDDVHPQGSRLNGQFDPAHGLHRMDADHPCHNRGQHDFHHGEIAEQKLPDNHIVFCRAAFLQQKAEHNAENQSLHRGDLSVDTSVFVFSVIIVFTPNR